MIGEQAANSFDISTPAWWEQRRFLMSEVAGKIVEKIKEINPQIDKDSPETEQIINGSRDGTPGLSV